MGKEEEGLAEFKPLQPGLEINDLFDDEGLSLSCFLINFLHSVVDREPEA